MEIAILIGALLALWAFIAWERRHLANTKSAPLSRKDISRGWAPSPVAMWPFFVGLALVFALLGFNEWLRPSYPPFTGRWSFVFNMVHSHFGVKGVVLLWWGIAAAFLAGAYVSWQARSSKKQ